MAPRVVVTNHQGLRQISVHVPYDVALIEINVAIGRTVGEATYRQWLDLDRLLAQFWESRSICLKMVSDTTIQRGRQDVRSALGVCCQRQ